ncbi:uncharacterized protein V6R79_003164 [Siganus canaliculatus]
MATFKTKWLLSILLINLPNGFAQTVSPGPPAPPSCPECFIPCDEKSCLVHITCVWDASQEPWIPVNYSLHWHPTDREGHIFTGTNLTGSIDREHFLVTDELHVWVQAMNQHGSNSSPTAVFNTENIKKPPPPKVTSSHHDALEIWWNSTCDQLQLSVGQCDVRHRVGTEEVWLEDDTGIYGSYEINPQPCMAYEFQVRCECVNSLMSDWSEIHKIQDIKSAPVGEVDIWRDCGISSASSDCVLMWKRLQISQACLILGYGVRLLTADNSPVLSVNVSVDVKTEPRTQIICNVEQCYLNYTLKGVSSVRVSAYNTHGATKPSYLIMPVSGNRKNEQDLHVGMTEETMTVSWETTLLSDKVKEYVIQYKQAGCPLGQNFAWVKVNTSVTTTNFKGRFKKYTPYQVSLFAVLQDSKINHLSSVLRYLLEGTPGRVSVFQVSSLAETHVTLYWEPLPLSSQRGLILFYEIGLNNHTVYNASASQQESWTYKLQQLSPGQEYEVWIRAVTVAGPGEKNAVRFNTTDNEKFAHRLLVGILIPLFICVLLFILFCAFCKESKSCSVVPSHYYQVPDPCNSHIFRNMNYQLDTAWLCIPVYEPHPKISVLEVVEIQRWNSRPFLEKNIDANGLTRPVHTDESLQMNCKDDHRKETFTEEWQSQRTVHNSARQAYSKMVDSDEERVEEDHGTLSEEEEGPSGYEKHFMPSAVEILEVS